MTDRERWIVESIALEKADDSTLERDEREAWIKLYERMLGGELTTDDARTLSIAVRADSLLQRDRQTAAFYRALSDKLITQQE